MSKVNESAVRLRLGRMVGGIECSIASLDVAAKSSDLLTDDDRQTLHRAREMLAGVEQRLWLRVSGKTK